MLANTLTPDSFDAGVCSLRGSRRRFAAIKSGHRPPTTKSEPCIYMKLFNMIVTDSRKIDMYM